MERRKATKGAVMSSFPWWAVGLHCTGDPLRTHVEHTSQLFYQMLAWGVYPLPPTPTLGGGCTRRLECPALPLCVLIQNMQSSAGNTLWKGSRETQAFEVDSCESAGKCPPQHLGSSSGSRGNGQDVRKSCC